MADFDGKTFSPKKNLEGGELSEVTFNHPMSDKPITIKSWPHTARDPYEQNFLETYQMVKAEGKNSGKSSAGNPAEGAGPSKEEQKEAK